MTNAELVVELPLIVGSEVLTAGWSEGSNGVVV